MNSQALIARLRKTPDVLDALLAPLADDAWRWRPEPGKWSLVEVVCHLVDEEIDDFRLRTRLTLDSPETRWPRTDPEAWVTERRYVQQDPWERLASFRSERSASVRWLGSLGPEVRWDARYEHPRGVLHAGDLLASWAAHDARHLGQVARILHGLAARDGAPWSVEYAG
jgi:hypothetical protein